MWIISRAQLAFANLNAYSSSFRWNVLHHKEDCTWGRKAALLSCASSRSPLPRQDSELTWESGLWALPSSLDPGRAVALNAAILLPVKGACVCVCVCMLQIFCLLTFTFTFTFQSVYTFVGWWQFLPQTRHSDILTSAPLCADFGGCLRVKCQTRIF